MQLFLSPLDSPLGALLLVTDAQQAVRALDFAEHKGRLRRGLREHHDEVELVEIPAPAEIAEALSRYFEGELEALNALRTATAGSPLQRRVWAALCRIPAGTTTTYGKLATDLGFDDPRAAIAIGAANGANPIAIIVPCHRVIASNGDLKGYACPCARAMPWYSPSTTGLYAPRAASTGPICATESTGCTRGSGMRWASSFTMPSELLSAPGPRIFSCNASPPRAWQRTFS